MNNGRYFKMSSKYLNQGAYEDLFSYWMIRQQSEGWLKQESYWQFILESITLDMTSFCLRRDI